MSKLVEFFYDFGSPTAYLAYTQLPAVAARAGAEIVWRPMLLGAVFKATGNQSPISVPAKGTYMLRELNRFARRYGVPLHMNPYFPINTISLMRGAFVAEDAGRLDAYNRAMFEAMWVRALDMGDPEVVAGVLRTAEFNPERFAEGVARPDVKERLKANTDEAVLRGAFGAPTFFVGDEMFWGQDRLDFVAEALAR